MFRVYVNISHKKALTNTVRDFLWWPLPDSNWGHKALQASALPTELKGHIQHVIGG